MRFYRLLALLLLIVTFSHGQEKDSIIHHGIALKALDNANYDSTSASINNRIDSLQLRINNALNPNLSVDQIFESLRERRKAKTASLKAKQQLDSIKGGLQHTIDSLTHLSLPTDKYKRKLDGVSQFSPDKYLALAQGKVGELQTKVHQPINGLESQINRPVNDVANKINEKLELMNTEGGSAANLPKGTGLKDLSIPGADPKTDTNLKTGLDVNPPEVGTFNNPLGDIKNPVAGQMEQLDQLKSQIDGVKDVPQQQIDRFKSMKEVKAVEGKAGQANEIIDKAQGYQQDVTNIAHGDLGQVEEIPKAIESRIAGMDEMKDFQKQTGEMAQYQDVLASANNPEAMVGMAKEQAIKYATDHFAGQQEALKAAMDKLGKLKSKYSEVASLKDLPKRVPNAMKGKPVIERIIPGFTFQIQKSSTLMLDLSPNVSWRFTGRFTAGAGWNERLSFQEWNQLVGQDRIFGPRVFSNFAFKKGFSLKAEVEKMNVYVPLFAGAAEGNRAWVWSVFAGFKKDYTFHKTVKGNVQMLYNLYDDRDSSPYVDRLNVRMGFEFPMKKRK